MKRTIRDHDGDPAVVRVNTSRFVFLRLSMNGSDAVTLFGRSANTRTACHCYTPTQARKLAAALMVASAKAEKARRRNGARR